MQQKTDWRPKKPSGQKKTEFNLDVEELKARTIDWGDCSEKEALDWALVYLYLAPGDYKTMISVSRIKQFMETTVQSKNQRMYQKIRELFTIKNASKLLNDPKFQRNINAIENFLKSLRTIENAYEYSEGVHNAIDAMAPKLDAPAEMDNVTRAKWLRIWVVVIQDQNCIWSDLNRNGIPEKQKIIDSNSQYIYPETLINLEETYFRQLNDGDFVLKLLQAFISLYPEQIQQRLYRFGELDGINKPDDLKVGTIRQGIKKDLFPNRWVTYSDFFFIKSALSEMVPAFLKLAVDIWNKDSLEEFPIFNRMLINPYTLKEEIFCSHKVGNIPNSENGKTRDVYIACQRELEMFVKVYQWLEEHEDFKFGHEKKTLAEYGLTGLVDEPIESCILAWVKEMGLVNSVRDVNMEVARKIVENQKLEKDLQEFYHGNLSAEEFFQKTGIKDRNQAISCFNHRVEMNPEEQNNMWQSLKRIKMFGENNALPHDRAYLAVFRYFMNHEEKKKLLSQQYVHIYARLAA